MGPFWSFCHGIIVYGITKEIPKFLHIRVKMKKLHDEDFTDFVPFMSIIGNGDEIFCFDKDNKIVLSHFSCITYRSFFLPSKESYNSSIFSVLYSLLVPVPAPGSPAFSQQSYS